MEGEGEGTSLVWEVWRPQVVGPAQKFKLQDHQAAASWQILSSRIVHTLKCGPTMGEQTWGRSPFRPLNWSQCELDRKSRALRTRIMVWWGIVVYEEGMLSWPEGHLALWGVWLEKGSLKGKIQGSIPSCSDLQVVPFKNHTKTLFDIQFPMLYSQILWCSSSEAGSQNLPVQSGGYPGVSWFDSAHLGGCLPPGERPLSSALRLTLPSPRPWVTHTLPIVDLSLLWLPAPLLCRVQTQPAHYMLAQALFPCCHHGYFVTIVCSVPWLL